MLMTEIADGFTPDALSDLAGSFYTHWLEIGYSTKKLDDATVDETIRLLYHHHGLKAPTIIRCASPWQLVVLPLLTRLILKASMDRNDVVRFVERLTAQLKAGHEPSMWLAALKRLHALYPGRGVLELPSDIGKALDLKSRQTEGSFWEQLKGEFDLQLSDFQKNAIEKCIDPAIRERLYSFLGAQVREHLVMRVRDISDSRRSSPHEVREDSLSWNLPLAQQLDVVLDSTLAGAFERTLAERVRSWSMLPNLASAFRQGQSATPREAAALRYCNRALALEVQSEILNILDNICWGPWELCRITKFAFAQNFIDRNLFNDELKAELAILNRLASSAAAYQFYENFCFVSERPVHLAVDERGRLSREDGPAMSFSDGYSIYAIEGVRVGRNLIEEPIEVSALLVESEPNAEIRRVMLRKIGVGPFLIATGARVVHRDIFGELYRKDMSWADEPQMFVKVVNSTAEPDGTFKEYFLRVPPTVHTAREAVAWTFDIPEQEYLPRVET